MVQGYGTMALPDAIVRGDLREVLDNLCARQTASICGLPFAIVTIALPI